MDFLKSFFIVIKGNLYVNYIKYINLQLLQTDINYPVNKLAAEKLIFIILINLIKYKFQILDNIEEILNLTAILKILTAKYSISKKNLVDNIFIKDQLALV